MPDSASAPAGVAHSVGGSATVQRKRGGVVPPGELDEGASMKRTPHHTHSTGAACVTGECQNTSSTGTDGSDDGAGTTRGFDNPVAFRRRAYLREKRDEQEGPQRERTRGGSSRIGRRGEANARKAKQGMYVSDFLSDERAKGVREYTAEGGAQKRYREEGEKHLLPECFRFQGLFQAMQAHHIQNDLLHSPRGPRTAQFHPIEHADSAQTPARGQANANDSGEVDTLYDRSLQSLEVSKHVLSYLKFRCSQAGHIHLYTVQRVLYSL